MGTGQKKIQAITFFLAFLLVQTNLITVYACVPDEDTDTTVYSFQSSFNISGRGKYEVTIYYPADGSAKPFPIIIFGHGFVACADWHTWIGKCLASNGYIALLFTVPNRLSSDVQQWVDGFAGAISLIQELNEAEQFRDMINMSRIGVMGHSMGAMASLIYASKNPNIKAVVSLAAPYLKDKHFGNEDIDKIKDAIDWDSVLSASQNITVPIQFQVGTRDAFAADTARIYFAASNLTSKQFVTIEGGNHIQYLDDKVIWNPYTISGLISLITSFIYSLDIETIKTLIALIIQENNIINGIQITIVFVDKLIGAAVAFNLDLPATISPSKQQETSAQNFLYFFNTYL